MSKQKEVRTSRSLETRVLNDGTTLAGYIAVFDSPSEDMGYTEILSPGCFTRSLQSGSDVVALINHDDNAPVGRTSAGTLQLTQDDKGLAYTIQLPNTTRANDMKESIQRGDLKGCSFGFICTKEEWDDKTITRTITDVDLIEVSVGVTFPAYPDTSSQLRNLPASMPREIRKLVEHRADTPKTKRVDGEDLTADCFLIVGDKDKTATWKLPVKFSDEAKTKNHIRNALARIDQVSGVSADDLKAAKEKLAALAKKYDIGQQENKSADDADDVEPNTYGCECDCDQCTDDNCMECSNPDCDDPNCLLNERSLSQQRALKVDQCTCMCPQCRSGSCGICSAEPQCEGAEHNSFSDWYDTVKRELDLD